MPRRSFSELSSLSYQGAAPRLDCPSELTGVARETFIQTVTGTDAKHFQPSDLPLLSAFCRAAALERQAAEELAKAAVTGGAPSAWLAVHASAVRSLTALATKLRLAPRSRTPNTPTRAPRVSYYDRAPLHDDWTPPT